MGKITGKILDFIFNSGHKHPYLEDIGCHAYPDNHWGGINGYKPFSCLRTMIRQRRKARKTKVDPRDCWDLDDAFYCWLYEHLCQLLADTNTDLTWRTFEHNGKTYTEGEYIEYLKDLCKQMILFDEFEGCPDLDWELVNSKENDKGYSTVEWKNTQEELELHNRIWRENYEKQEAMRKELCDVFCELLPHLWW